MEVEKLMPFVILMVLTGMLLGVGLVIFEKFGSATYYSDSNNNSLTRGANMTKTSLAWGNISNTALWNGTVSTIPSECYVLDETAGTFNFTNTSAGCDFIADTIYLVYDYKNYATETAAAMTSVIGETDNISSDWFGLIITVFVLALILGLVIVAFQYRR